MARELRFIERATGVALTSTCHYRHGAVITRGSKVVAWSPNIHRNDPDLDHANSSWHAEEAAIRELCRSTGQTYGRASFKNYSIFVARVNPRNEPRLSRPCEVCWNMLVEAGFTGVYYTNNLQGLSHEILM